MTLDPRPFADEWCGAWNAHDVDAVLAHFHDDVVFTSPVAARLLPDSGGVVRGVVRGKEALRAYWNDALTAMPDLKFEVIGVHRGCVDPRDQVPQ